MRVSEKLAYVGPATGQLLTALFPLLVVHVRAILGIMCLLLGVGLASCSVEWPASRVASNTPPQWVRTVDGWERADTWHVSKARPPQLHPLVVAAGQGLVSVMGLVACGRQVRGRETLAQQ